MINLLLALSLVSQTEHVIAKDTYRLGPGDKIEVFVDSKISYSYVTAVDLNGQIDVYTYQFGASGISMALKTGPNIQIPQPLDLVKSGYLYVAGKTISEVEDELAAKLHAMLSGGVASVKIRLVETRVFTIPVLGRVVNPGMYVSNPLQRVSNLILQAGGVRSDGDPSRILVVRSDIVVDTVNLNRFAFLGDMDANPFVSEGIKIVVPELKEWVFVSGAVNGSPFQNIQVSSVKSGESQQNMALSVPVVQKASSLSGHNVEIKVPYHEGMTVEEAINFAGGPQPYADLNSVNLKRSGNEMPVELKAALQPFDTVTVPFMPQDVYVTGQVVTPGSYPFKPGLTVADYIGMAGGVTDRASSHISIISRDGKKIKVKWDHKVRPGDRILVHEKTFKWWQDYIYILSVLTSIAVTWLTISK